MYAGECKVSAEQSRAAVPCTAGAHPCTVACVARNRACGPACCSVMCTRCRLHFPARPQVAEPPYRHKITAHKLRGAQAAAEDPAAASSPGAAGGAAEELGAAADGAADAQSFDCCRFVLERLPGQPTIPRMEDGRCLKASLTAVCCLLWLPGTGGGIHTLPADALASQPDLPSVHPRWR